MLKQAALGLNSRSEANPYNKDGFLPLITAPMYSVVNESNYQVFLDNKIQVCLPRNTGGKNSGNYFLASSLEEFENEFIKDSSPIKYWPLKRCIDTANGNMPELHDAIRKAKELHGDKLIIMAGNVASVEAFVELAKTGVDYIRVGIGGGGGCNTTSNTGVGQEDLEKLISSCYKAKYQYTESFSPSYWFSAKKDLEQRINQELQKIEHNSVKGNRLFSLVEPDVLKSWVDQNNLLKVKIVADGISSYIKQCETKYGFNDNGYAAINKLLFAGADLVMVGKLFAQCLESAGEKTVQTFPSDEWTTEHIMVDNYMSMDSGRLLYVKYSGMSTLEEQKKYKNCPICKNLKVTSDSYPCYNCNREEYEKITGQKSPNKNSYVKPSEGSVSWIPVRWTLDSWLNGSKNQDTYPYLIGWVNSVKSAMAYRGQATLNTHAITNI